MTTELSGLLPVKERLDSEHPGHCGAQDTFYVGKLTGMGRVSNAINRRTDISEITLIRTYRRRHGIDEIDPKPTFGSCS